jgi:anti-sigma factor RsiW
MTGHPHNHDYGHGHARDPLCLETFALLSEYLDGELATEDCAAIEEHIAGCPPCVEFLEELRASVDAAKGLKTPSAPVHVDEELRKRLQKAWSDALIRRSSAVPSAVDIEEGKAGDIGA